MKILVIQNRMGIGDMIMFLPFVKAISNYYGEQISLMVKKNTKASEYLNEEKYIKEIIYLERSEVENRHAGIKGFFNLVKDFKEKKFDKVFIFNSSLRFLLISKMAGIKNISQYPLFRKKDNIVTSAKIFTENELGEIVSTQPELILNEDKVNEAKQKFSKEFKHICLGISASGPTKRWDIKNFIKLCININARTPSKFYLAAGNNDKDLIDQFLNSELSNNCISFKDLKISETLPIIKNCNLYIGNDTGWLHISSALGIKCLALFMDSPVQAYGKYSKNIEVIVPEGETEETTTHDTLGADKISFEKVFNVSIKLLN